MNGWGGSTTNTEQDNLDSKRDDDKVMAGGHVSRVSYFFFFLVPRVDEPPRPPRVVEDPRLPFPFRGCFDAIEAAVAQVFSTQRWSLIIPNTYLETAWVPLPPLRTPFPHPSR